VVAAAVGGRVRAGTGRLVAGGRRAAGRIGHAGAQALGRWGYGGTEGCTAAICRPPARAAVGDGVRDLAPASLPSVRRSIRSCPGTEPPCAAPALSPR
jgi:hypothetical protein